MKWDGNVSGMDSDFGLVERGPTPPKRDMETNEAPELKDESTELTHEELVQAAKDSGLAVIDQRKVKGLAKIGKYLKKAGLIDIGRGRLAGRLQALETAREVCLGLVTDKVTFLAIDKEKPVVYHEIVLAAANTLVAIVTAENKTDELAINLDKATGIKAPNSAPQNQLPPNDAPLVAVQVGQGGQVTMVDHRQSDKVGGS